MLGFAGGTHGWGNLGGSAIAVNSKYAYVAIGVGNERGHLQSPGIWPDKGKQWFGISRRTIGDMKQPAPFRAAPQVAPGGRADTGRARMAASFMMMNEVSAPARSEVGEAKAEVGGLAADDKTLFATNPSRDVVDVYDAETMQQKGTWSAHEPGRIALAGDGTLWLLTDTLGGPAHLVHVRADGRKLDDAPALPEGTDAVDVAVDAKGRVLVADNGPRQQILIFSKGGKGYAPSGTLGERGGIFAGPVPGRPGPQRFNGLTGVGVDRAGNIYVSMNGIGPRHDTIGAGLGAVLESYTPDGKLRWQVQGLLFVDGAWLDPARPNSVYTGNKRFELDLSKPPGQDWKYVGFLSNRFKYPDDPVFHTDQYPGMPIARRVDGRTFLYLTDMYADHLKIYRFDAKRDGEVAIPSGLIAGARGRSTRCRTSRRAATGYGATRTATAGSMPTSPRSTRRARQRRAAGAGGSTRRATSGARATCEGFIASAMAASTRPATRSIRTTRSRPTRCRSRSRSCAARSTNRRRTRCT